ncbi:MAG: FAD-dependent oxidoreductase [Bacteroidales bacterium]|jgi:NAD(P)H-flavin reductase|nr:FAD-dependent oxidoreductase [Bacteroidales bacterium]
MGAPRKVKAEIIAVSRYSDGVTLYQFKPEHKCRFRPGQFLHLAIEPYDPSFPWPESRVFSIASIPKSELIEILISPKGDFTKRMVEELKVGDEVWLKLPFGVFNFKDAKSRDVVLIGGGTGISPFIAYLEEFIEASNSENKMTLYYGVRNTDLIIYNDLLKKLEQHKENFKLELYIEEGDCVDFSYHNKGMMDVMKIIEKSKKMNDPVYYISGPKAMINSCISNMSEANVNDENIFYDKWE